MKRRSKTIRSAVKANLGSDIATPPHASLMKMAERARFTSAKVMPAIANFSDLISLPRNSINDRKGSTASVRNEKNVKGRWRYINL